VASAAGWNADHQSGAAAAAAQADKGNVMRPRPMPANAKWKDWPTLESLIKAYPDIKLTTLRALLRRVPCYKADDNTVRYRPKEAELALRGAELEPEDIDDQEDDAGDAPREPDDQDFYSTVETLPAPVLMMLIRDQRRSFEDGARSMREAMRTMGETIRLMADPLRMGIQMNKEAAERNAAELAKHQRTYDRMVSTTEDLLSERVDRELKVDREKQVQKFRADAMDLAKTHGGEVLRKWGLTAEASAAVDFLRSLDPTVIMLARAQGFVTDEQMAQLRKVRSDLPTDAEPDAAAAGEPVQ
jgi:hypothetical protein